MTANLAQQSANEIRWLAQSLNKMRGLRTLVDELGAQGTLETRSRELASRVEALEAQKRTLSDGVNAAEAAAAAQLAEATKRGEAIIAEAERLKAAAQADRDAASRVLVEAQEQAREIVASAQATAREAVRREVDAIKARL